MNTHKNSTELGTYNRKLMHKPWSWWGSLAQLAESKGIRKYSGFIIMVPFIIGLLNKIPGEPIQAPLSWAFGYFAGIFFMLAALLVGMWCPKVARYDYKRFKKEGRTGQFILQQLRELYLGHSSSPKRANHMLQGLLGDAKYTTNHSYFKDIFPNDKKILMERDQVWSLVAKAELETSALDECLWYIQWFAGSVDERKRMLISILFGFGIASAILFLFVQIIMVVKHFIIV